jgi:hypothetical protein
MALAELLRMIFLYLFAGLIAYSDPNAYLMLLPGE